MERRMLTAFAQEVDGLTLPVALAGHAALDFCNTLAGWGEDETGEYLKSYDHLAVWTAAYGLVEPSVAGALRRRARRRPDAAEEVLRDARDLRAALYSVALAPHPGPDWDRVAVGASASAAAALFELHDGRGMWVLPESIGLGLPVLAVAREAAAMLASPDLAAVRACPGSQCGWLFLDRSGRRRWCTMSTCGNRDKVRRFAERRRASARGSRKRTEP
jgi:predicted RNA-binding Zn ribbon-like protein